MNDTSNTEFLLSCVCNTAAYVAFHRDDIVAYQQLAQKRRVDDAARMRHAEKLIRTGDPKRALRWLELEIPNADQYDLEDLRIDAALGAEDHRGAIAHINRAFLHTFDESYFQRMVRSGADETACRIIRSQLVGELQTAQHLNAARAMHLLVRLQEWEAVEQLYIRFRDVPVVFFGFSGKPDGVPELVELLHVELPEVACGLLREIARYGLKSNWRFEKIAAILERSIDLCSQPTYNPSHFEFFQNLQTEFSTQRRLRRWLERVRADWKWSA